MDWFDWLDRVFFCIDILREDWDTDEYYEWLGMDTETDENLKRYLESRAGACQLIGVSYERAQKLFGEYVLPEVAAVRLKEEFAL